MAANGTGTLPFIDDFTADRRNRMNAEVYRNILCALIQTNASKTIGRQNLKKIQSKQPKSFLGADWPIQSPGLSRSEHLLNAALFAAWQRR